MFTFFYTFSYFSLNSGQKLLQNNSLLKLDQPVVQLEAALVA